MSYFICDTEFNGQQDYQHIFNEYPFELSDFQKWAIKSILNNHNVLITAHTGSGKTLPAEFAINHFTNLNKKVIYCSPIKALSNEKFNAFNKKFPNISFGILTGDIKYNPEAQVLIMTTEILRNNLFKYKEEKNKNLLDFEMDFDTELACVVYDEIHYINDVDRGTVWEEAIMMTPKTTQIIGLSATINKPENLCKFMSTSNNLVTMLCPNEKRVVPLEHYSYFTVHNNILKKLDNKSKTIFEKTINKPQLLKNTDNPVFNEKTYHNVKDLHNILYKNRLQKINKYYIMNTMIKYLKDNDMLPALSFVFSRRGCYDYANKITVPLFEDGSKIPSIIAKECEKILISKLDNWREYTDLKEYKKIIKLLEKGIAVHHSGVTPVFREMIELLFSKGYIKLLFATETFAVGINMPTRTVIFTSLIKYSNSGFRPLYPHEYTQMAGRAGRRGIDIKGYVFHLNNLFINNNEIDLEDYRKILTGKSQIIKSKFNINHNLILSIVDSRFNLQEFVNNSLMNDEISSEIQQTKSEIDELNEMLNKTIIEVKSSIKTSYKLAEEWYDIKNNYIQIKNKEIEKRKKKIIEDYGNFNVLENDIKLITKIKNIQININKKTNTLNNSKNYIENIIQNCVNLLKYQNFINDDNSISLKGNVAYNIQEIPTLAFCNFLFDNINTINRLSPKEFICVLSVFSPIRIQEEYKVYDYNTLNISPNCKMLFNKLNKSINNYKSLENKFNVYSYDFEIQYDICELVYKWCEASNEKECNVIFDELEYWGIFLGDFIKSLLKICNMGIELEKCCEIMENMELMSTIKKMPSFILKSVITNKSLYL